MTRIRTSDPLRAGVRQAVTRARAEGGDRPLKQPGAEPAREPEPVTDPPPDDTGPASEDPVSEPVQDKPEPAPVQDETSDIKEPEIIAEETEIRSSRNSSVTDWLLRRT